MQEYAQNMHKICKFMQQNIQKDAFYMQKYKQKYVKIRTVFSKNIQKQQSEIRKKYARNMNFFMQKYAMRSVRSRGTRAA